MPTPTVKAAQDAEAHARQEAGVDPAENAIAIEGSDVDQGGSEGSTPQRQAQPPAADDQTRAPPPVRAPFEDKRNAIISRFKASRGEEPEADAVDTDQMREFTRSGIPPEFTETPVVEPQDQQQQDQQQADQQAAPVVEPQPALPPTVKLKVHGQEKDYTLEEVIAKAQIALASDNLLDASKARLKEVDDLLAQARDRAQRADPPAQHQGRQNGTQPADPAPVDPAADPQHQADPLTELIETLQFGDPGKARTLLGNTIQEVVAKATSTTVAQTLQAQRLKDEGARSDKVLKKFLEDHADLAADPMAQAAIERNVYDLQVEDLKALGVDPSKLQTPSGVVTPADIAVAHRWYRAEGYKVRGPGEMLETATDNFLTWKGVGKKAPNPADPAQRAAPRVEVTVDRTARRAAIPQQPTRTAVPRQDAPAAPARKDGSDIVRGMAALRSRPRGRVGVQ